MKVVHRIRTALLPFLALKSLSRWGVLACGLVSGGAVALAGSTAERGQFVSVLPSELSFVSNGGSKIIGGYYPFLYEAESSPEPPPIYLVRSVSGQMEFQYYQFIGGWGFGMRDHQGASYYDPETNTFINEQEFRSRGRSSCNGAWGEWGNWLTFGGPIGDTIESETVQIGTRDNLIPCDELWRYGGSVLRWKDIDVRTELAEEVMIEELSIVGPEPTGTSATAFLSGNFPVWTSGAEVRATVSAQNVEYRAVFPESCGGEYQIRYTWEVREGSSTAAPKTVYEVESRRLNPDRYGRLIVEGSYVGERNRWRRLRNVELLPQGCVPCDLDPRGDIVGLGSVQWHVGLGRLSSLQTAGRLWIAEESMTDLLYDPGVLSYLSPPGSDIEVRRRSDERSPLRQILTPQYLVDILTHAEDDAIPSPGFEVRFYAADDGLALTGDFYEPSGQPLVSYRFEEGTSEHPGLRISKFLSGSSSPALVREFLQDSLTGVWSLREGGLRETMQEGALRIEKDGAGNIVSLIAENWTALPFAGAPHELLTERVVYTEVDESNRGIEATARVTSYTYYGMGGDGITEGDARYGRLRHRQDPGGYWEIYDYDDQGRLTKTVSPYQANPFTDPAVESANRVNTVVYGALGLGDEDITRVERVLGLEVSRSYEIHTDLPDGREVTLIRCATPGASWDDPANHVTLQVYDEEDRLVKSLGPDGTLMLATYTANGRETTVVRKTGQPNSTRDDVVDGVRTETVENFAGQVIEERHYDIASNALLSFAIVPPGDVDIAGRPTRMEFLDGTSWTRHYGCCGLESETDREGVTTDYFYDALGRRVATTRNGLTFEEVRGYSSGDPGGPTLTRVRRGSDGSAQTQTAETFDLAGRRIAETDARGNRTHYREVFLPGSRLTESTTTYADGSTVVETRLPGGDLIEVSGSASYPKRFEYGGTQDTHDGISFNATWEREILPTTPGNSETHITTFRDMLGQIYKVERSGSDGSAVVVATQFYDNRGRLVRTVDGDGVTTLFRYDPRGELQEQVVDLNRNGSVDYEGDDRITRTGNRVTADPDRGVVRRTTTMTWTDSGLDTPETIAVIDQSASGLETWQTVYGQTTHTQTEYDGQGGRTETTTAPEGLITVAAYAGGLLQSQTTTNPAGETLSALTYTYDSLNRVATVTDGRGTTTRFTYFPDDRIATITEPDPGGGSPWVTSYFYDARGREETVILPDGTRREQRYNARGELVKSWGGREYPVEFSYDLQGRLIAQTTWKAWDPADGTGIAGAATTGWVIDALGNLLEKQYDLQPDGTYTPGPSYTYSPAGRLLSRHWARGVSTNYTYNPAGDLIRTTYSDGTPEINRAYDRQGRPVQIADAAGVRTLHHDQGLTTAETMVSSAIPGLGGVILTRELDSFNRVSTIRVDSAASAEPAYLVALDYRHPESNLETGRLTRIAAGGLSHHYAYLPGSSLIREITSETTFGLARTEMRSYDSRNRLTAIATQTNGPGNRMFSYSYNRADQRLRTDREDGSYWEYTYDTYGQVVSGQKTSADNTPVPGHQLGYAYDAIGNRIRTTNGDAETGYDSNRLNQITHRRNPRQTEIRGAADPDAQVTVNNQPATRDGGYFSAILSAPPGDTPYPLDVDIEARLPGAGADGADAVATETGQILIPPGHQAFTYDADGNLTTDGLWNYTWNAENRLIAMEQQWQRPGQPRQRLTFTYDASGRRVAKAVYQEDNNDWTLKAHHTFLYDGWNLVWELTTTDTANTQKKYTWGIDLSGTLQGAGGVGGLLAVETTTAEASSLALPTYDGNGNIHVYTDPATGQTLATWEYDPTGRQTRTTGDPDRFPHQFSTKYHDPETELLYYGFRYYNPENGRWLNRDPIEEQGGLNLYGFVGKDGVNAVDVLGLRGIPTLPGRPMPPPMTPPAATGAGAAFESTSSLLKNFVEFNSELNKAKAKMDAIRIMNAFPKICKWERFKHPIAAAEGCGCCILVSVLTLEIPGFLHRVPFKKPMIRGPQGAPLRIDHAEINYVPKHCDSTNVEIDYPRILIDWKHQIQTIDKRPI